MRRREIVVKVLAATVGALAGAGIVAGLTARLFPAAPENAFALGAHLFVPLWAGLACTLPLLGRRR